MGDSQICWARFYLLPNGMPEHRKNSLCDQRYLARRDLTRNRYYILLDVLSSLWEQITPVKVSQVYHSQKIRGRRVLENTEMSLACPKIAEKKKQLMGRQPEGIETWSSNADKLTALKQLFLASWTGRLSGPGPAMTRWISSLAKRKSTT